MKKKKFSGWYVFMLILAVCAAALLYFRANPVVVSAESINPDNLATTTIETGTITKGISTTGTVRTVQSASLSWSASGQVSEVLVKVGDQVQKGQVLAKLDPASNPDWQTAQANLLLAQENLASLSDTAAAVATAKIALVNAQSAVDNAQKTLDDLNVSATQAQIDAANAAYLQDQKNVEKLQTVYNVISEDSQDDLALAKALENLHAAILKENEDYATLNYYKNGQANPTALADAESSLALAKSKLAIAQSDYDAVKDGPSEADINAAQAKIDSINATLEGQSILAPFNGVISAVDTQANDLVSVGDSAFRIDDESALYIDFSVSEVDIPDVYIGQSIDLTFDAVSGSQYNARVSAVSSVGVVSGGTSDYTVTAQLTDPGDAILPGMTAAAEIITKTATDVMLVPNLSLSVLNGHKVVYVVRDGQVSPISVDTGLVSDTRTEISSQYLKAGDVIVINPASLSKQDSGGIRMAFDNLLQVLGVTTQG